MPPCLDVYVWVDPEGRRFALEQFIERYVDAHDPGDARLAALESVYVCGTGTGADAAALRDLRRDESAGDEFSLYLHARQYEWANVTVTREGAVVLGVSLDDPFHSPEVLAKATRLVRRLCQEFSARDGLAGAELPPPQSWSEWTQAERLRPPRGHRGSRYLR